MARWLYFLMPLGAIAFVLELFGVSPLVVFPLAALGIIPLAGLLGVATEDLAHHSGPRLGGLLNATFGNAAELIITILALQKGLIPLVKASLTGSIIGNALLVLGAAALAGGLRYGIQRFDAHEAQRHATMMILAVAGLLLPSLFAFSVRDFFIREELSILLSVVLLIIYGAYIYYSFFSRDVHQTEQAPADGHESAVAVGATAASQGQAAPGRARRLTPLNARAAVPTEQEPERRSWSVRFAIIVLAGATIATAVVSEVLVSTVEPVTQQLGWSELFVGVIIIPLIGNIAEHFSAIQVSLKNNMNLSLSITAGSSTQIALLVAPLLVFISLLVGHPMSLEFTLLELLILGLSVGIFSYICQDGETNWLEGAQLLALYLMGAVVFFFVVEAVPH